MIKGTCGIEDSVPQSNDEHQRDILIHQLLMCIYVKAQMNTLIEDKFDLSAHEGMLAEIVENLKNPDADLPKIDSFQIKGDFSK